jgi:ATP-dependent helicase HepA
VIWYKKGLAVPEKYVEVRCNKPIEDPTEVLIARGQETPFFYDKRASLVRCFIDQRSVSRGMTGLFSANIDLFPHQVEVVRRVLEDPIQRYLLADEVGLGKTIEAGAILRQFLLDDPEGTAIIIVPKQLLGQWRQELKHKFYITDQVELITPEELVSTNANKNPDFLIIDEAHHIAAMSVSTNRRERNLFDICRKMSHGTRGLLLLSATPALNNEESFLAMLHLLDPASYRLDDLEGFRNRLRDRQEIGEILFRFVETAPLRILNRSLITLKDKFACDDRLISFINLLESNISESNERGRLVRVIRTHISDTYRLHRRMLRNRRQTVQEMDVLLDQSSAIVRVEYDEDERSFSIQEELDEWRITAISNASSDIAYSQKLQQIFLLLFCASGTWLGILEWVLITRLNSIVHPSLLENFNAESIQLLTSTPKFFREEEILERLLEIVRTSPECGDRIAHLQAVLQNLQYSTKARKPKIVVFTSFLQTCKEICSQLSNNLGEIAIATFQDGQTLDEVEANTLKFKNKPDCFVLVSDLSGEEGHNLQFADWVIHFDIPLSPNRMEQRNGRLNRIGLTHLMQYVVFAGADVRNGLHGSWLQLLQDGFRVFKESISSLQFYADEKLPELEKILFQSGAYKIQESIYVIQSEIIIEKERIDEQNALDEIDALEDRSIEYFQELNGYDAKHKVIRQAVEGWLCHALHFERNRQLWESDGIVRYSPTYRTLMPLNDIYLFAKFIKQPLAYNRLKAIKNSEVQLCRIGNGLNDQLAEYIRWDDRGQAFSMWRHEESWSAEEGMEWVGFRFDYIVETDLAIAEDILQNWQNANIRAIMRRADALFPPLIKTIFIDTRANLVDDIQLLNVLCRPYYGKGCQDQPRDYNLGSRLHILDEFVSRDDWADVCQNTRRQSESLLRQLPDFLEYCQSSTEKADKELSDRLYQLELRLERQNVLSSKLAEEVEIEKLLRQALLQGIQQPKIRLDSIGFYIVSGRSPSKIAEEEDV